MDYIDAMFNESLCFACCSVLFVSVFINKRSLQVYNKYTRFDWNVNQCLKSVLYIYIFAALWPDPNHLLTWSVDLQNTMDKLTIIKCTQKKPFVLTTKVKYFYVIN
jgi:hypothetical protein